MMLRWMCPDSSGGLRLHGKRASGRDGIFSAWKGVASESMSRPTKAAYAGVLAVALFWGGCGHGNVDKGETSLRLGDYPAAIEFFEEELKRHPDSYEARLGLGKAMLQKSVDAGGDSALWKRGLMHLEAARTLAPSEQAEHIEQLLSEAWAHHARSLLSGGDTLASLSALSRAIEYQPSGIEPLNLAGVIYFRLGDARKATALFERAVEIDSTHPSAHFNLGMVRFKAGDITAAHAHWLRALKLSPQDEDILYWFALAEKELREAR
ncbi:MAG: tetratricopeptide repeat protein [Chitinivibrionales bacterium]|nr:tetratricopeptide repeat protein [Chitinivibrionales bacterium]MBD3396983.1 tetratricopeptide repeat protein [Chitinivibrionales bacterium]